MSKARVTVIIDDYCQDYGLTDDEIREIYIKILEYTFADNQNVTVENVEVLEVGENEIQEN